MASLLLLLSILYFRSFVSSVRSVVYSGVMIGCLYPWCTHRYKYTPLIWCQDWVSIPMVYTQVQIYTYILVLGSGVYNPIPQLGVHTGTNIHLYSGVMIRCLYPWCTHRYKYIYNSTLGLGQGVYIHYFMVYGKVQIYSFTSKRAFLQICKNILIEYKEVEERKV